MRSIPSNTHTKHTVIIIAVFYSLREPNNSKNCELPFSNSEQLHFLSESPPLCSISIRWFWVESLEKLKTKRTQFIFSQNVTEQFHGEKCDRILRREEKKRISLLLCDQHTTKFKHTQQITHNWKFTDEQFYKYISIKSRTVENCERRKRVSVSPWIIRVYSGHIQLQPHTTRFDFRHTEWMLFTFSHTIFDDYFYFFLCVSRFVQIFRISGIFNVIVKVIVCDTVTEMICLHSIKFW